MAETFVGMAATAEEASGSAPKRRGLGEAAIAEFLANIDQVVEPGVPVLLLFEDADIRRINAVLGGDVHLLSTWAFLVGLAEVGAIPPSGCGRPWRLRDVLPRRVVDQPSPDTYKGSYWEPDLRKDQVHESTTPP